jgi:hypothetical protein
MMRLLTCTGVCPPYVEAMDIQLSMNISIVIGGIIVSGYRDALVNMSVTERQAESAAHWRGHVKHLLGMVTSLIGVTETINILCQTFPATPKPEDMLKPSTLVEQVCSVAYTTQNTKGKCNVRQARQMEKKIEACKVLKEGKVKEPRAARKKRANFCYSYPESTCCLGDGSGSAERVD